MHSMRFKTMALAVLLLLSASVAVSKMTINGVTSDSKGKVISGAMITILDPNGAVVGTGQTDKKGKFKVAVETAGNYVLQIEADEYGPYEKHLFLESGSSLPKSFYSRADFL